MESKQNQQQQSRKPESGGSEAKGKIEDGKGKIEDGLPMKDSPYLQFDNIEDYKREAYGTEGHQKVETGRGAGSTEGPTVSGANVTSQSDISATETINRQGVP